MASLDKPHGVRLVLVEHPDEAAQRLADEIQNAMARAASMEQNLVLGLPTGRSPRPLFDELIRRHRQELLSFQDVATFNLDEYVATGAPDDRVSFQWWMNDVLFSHLDIAASARHFPTVTADPALFPKAAQSYEAQIRQAGGIDLLILGLGENGHVAFNEPGSEPNSRTRVVDLAESTRKANRDYFPPGSQIPRQAMSMGIATILDAKSLRMLAFGAHKRMAVSHLLEGDVELAWPCSHLRTHPDLVLFIDAEAASALSPESFSR